MKGVTWERFFERFEEMATTTRKHLFSYFPISLPFLITMSHSVHPPA